LLNMGKPLRSNRFLFCFVIILIIIFAYTSQVAGRADEGTPSIDSFVMEILRKADVKGMSITIVQDETTTFKSYGYANSEYGVRTDNNTLYEIGSNSKAFTALGVLYLEKEGLLSLKDPVSQHLPWFKVFYKGRYDGSRVNTEVELTIEDLFYHTSGIPFSTLGDIPVGDTDDMLEKTVRMLTGMKLDFYPGTRYSYATINYDVLGLIIQNISGISYEAFIQRNILKPLGLNHTYLSLGDAVETGRVATGYKASFFSTREYQAPVYRGNTPAGYLISSASDMERWMKIQMGLIEVPEFYRDLIRKSQQGNTKVTSFGDYFYGGGWLVHTRGVEIKHEGSNPNFSSMIVIRPEKKLGISILSNVNSNAANYLATNILNILEGKTVSKYKTDIYKGLDHVFSLVTVGAILSGVLFFVLSIKALIDIRGKKRKMIKAGKGKALGVSLAVLIMVFFGFCVYYLPNILMQRLAWGAVVVWGSPLIVWGCYGGFAAGIIFMVYTLITFSFPKEHEKGYLALVPLSIINGLMSALIIFTINETFNRGLEYSKELLVYFAFSLLFFVYSMKLLQGKLIQITNEITYEKRMSMVDRLMCSSFQTMERIGGQRIYTGLNNDTTAISRLPEVLVRLVSDALTLIFCLGFLFSKSVYAFVASISIIVLNGLISFLTSIIARKLWEENRNIQDIFFGQMSDLVNGFKELVLGKLRKLGFYNDIKKYAGLSKELNMEASTKILNFNMYNTLMYNIVFGVVVFVFPLFMHNISVNELREILFIVFYMIGPFVNVAGSIPQLTAIGVNIRRIDVLLGELDNATGSSLPIADSKIINGDINIKLNDVEYTYMVQDENGKNIKEFTFGPVNLDFKTGEITFITGGNGSGKSTLAKLITGLYAPEKGFILVNDKPAELEELNDCFTAVFSDFHLFKKLYGIDHDSNSAEIATLFDKMKIANKVGIKQGGELTTLNLSTGHKKRLAFIISYMDGKPMMLFDEWAAEQDPDFRHYFYNELLPGLKKSGKGVIVITHDDRYFNVADRLIKLERGVIVGESETSAPHQSYA